MTQKIFLKKISKKLDCSFCDCCGPRWTGCSTFDFSNINALNREFGISIYNNPIKERQYKIFLYLKDGQKLAAGSIKAN